MTAQEGVIRFRFDHRREELPAELAAVAALLARWRRALVELGVVGQDADRYGGYGFGNLSARVGRRSFLVTGSQTGHLADLDPARFALVESWDAAAHRLASRGLVAPSSESLTHAALYDASPRVGAVFHVHSAALWGRRGSAELPETAPGIEQGTPEMVAEVARLTRRGLQRRSDGGRSAEPAGLLAMGGHEDGILAYGADPDDAGRALVAALDV